MRVTSVFSSAAASRRVRTERDVCRAENCVRKTSETIKISKEQIKLSPLKIDSYLICLSKKVD